MNPLNHFGIRTQFIRGDTKSYNDEDDLIPPKKPIIPNQYPKNSRMVVNNEKVFYGSGITNTHVIDESKPTHTVCGKMHRTFGFPEPIRSKSISCKTCLKRSRLEGTSYEYIPSKIIPGR